MKFLNQFRKYHLQAPEDDKGGGGGAPPPAGNPPAPDSAKELADLKASNAALMARLEKLEGSKAPPKEDDDLTEKARKTREAEAKRTGDHKAIEAALKFSLKSEDFLKQNSSLLPKDVGDIFKQAEKENFESAIEKDQAIKAGLVQSFFSVQSNMDLLTPALKSQLEEYLKLTKNGKQDKAQQIYDSIFEPTFEMLKRIKKAEALNSGYSSGTDSESAYKDKMMKLSKKHYLGDKTDA